LIAHQLMLSSHLLIWGWWICKWVLYGEKINRCQHRSTPWVV